MPAWQSLKRKKKSAPKLQVSKKTACTTCIQPFLPYLRPRAIHMQHEEVEILSRIDIAFGSAPRREADSEPISQLVRQAVSHAVSRASRQAGRQTETHSVDFFGVRLGYKQRGATCAPQPALVEWKTTQPPLERSPVRFPAGEKTGGSAG